MRRQASRYYAGLMKISLIQVPEQHGQVLRKSGHIPILKTVTVTVMNVKGGGNRVCKRLHDVTDGVT